MRNLYNGWHVLYVKSRHEKKVYDFLSELSLEAYLPLIKTIKKWSDRKKVVHEPLFPSYVFVNLTSSLDFHKAFSVSGACAYIRFGKEYAIVTDKEVNQIKLLIGSKDVTDVVMGTQLPKVGEIKKINYGALSGLNCEVLKVGNVNKIIVQIESLQQNITASIPSYYFEGE
ncbi:Transcription antitermination protein RfaH [Kordia antarctica]|uniref:Transcription antitermination protein RfaH n=1 Tax=Kordia antarctica TaxID=1218801 RepID=A0A7L4ZFH4_9FLAO|nr:UpxY family transcription antiterminator [Kordia antarctica]QHI35413.1 Transcription antitermination protein RfaH [Kordia antarctica]